MVKIAVIEEGWNCIEKRRLFLTFQFRSLINIKVKHLDCHSKNLYHPLQNKDTIFTKTCFFRLTQ